MVHFSVAFGTFLLSGELLTSGVLRLERKPSLAAGSATVVGQRPSQRRRPALPPRAWYSLLPRAAGSDERALVVAAMKASGHRSKWL